jgi:hypothetical protein
MSKFMLKRFLFLLVLSLFFFVPVTRAQGPLRFTEVEVDLWPEYDRPEVLVIYHVKLPSDIPLPAEVTLRIPAVVGKPHAVAVRQMDGALLNAVYEQELDGEWSIIRVTATMPEIQLEYYDPQIVKDEGLRSFTFEWLGDYAADTMRIAIQQPIGAQQMSVTPDLGSFVQHQGDPMQYYTMDVGSPKAGETVSVELTYFKDSDILSIEGLQVQPSAPINGNPGTQSGWVTILPWLIGGLGVLLLIGGGLWYWRINAVETPSVSKRRRRRANKAIKSPEQVSVQNDSDTQNIYCHQCGKRAVAGDRFCRVCGTKLRNQ